MSTWAGVTNEAFQLLVNGDTDTYRAMVVTLQVSGAATAAAALLGVPLGLVIGVSRFRGRSAVQIVLNTSLSVPTVVIGLLVYLALARRGPLGSLGLLFTPTAMVVGEVLLALPILVAFTVSAVSAVPREVRETAESLGAGWWQASLAVLDEARFGVLAAVVAAFGRVISEVGAALMLGGNIRGVTRTMTTAIATETSQGKFGLALALGLVLMLMAFGANLLFHYCVDAEARERPQRRL
ncbi:MAG: ABC transporter permease [Planctomycetes bacterium]|nr:ABC transporter permease [Planctomycetota bacterium]